MDQAIYRIINIKNGNFYIGSAKNNKVRTERHRRQLRAGTHHNAKLQQAWNDGEEHDFLFQPTKKLPDDTSTEDRYRAEQKLLDEHYGKPYCYNTNPFAIEPPHPKGADHPLYGTIRSPETRARISAGVQKADAEGRGKRHHEVTEETRAKMSEALMGNECAKGHVRTEAHKRHLSESLKGNQNWLNKHHSDESRAKMGRVLVELTTGKEFAVMNDAVKFYGMPNLTQIYRQMKSGKPITRGKYKGLMFAYKGDTLPEVPTDPTIPEEYAELPRDRATAKTTGAKRYFTGIPCKRGHISPRATKGTCIECRREDDRAKPKKPKSEAAKAAGRKYYEKHKEEVKERAKARPADDQRRYKRDYKERQKAA